MSLTETERETRTINEPQPGYWLVRLNRHSPWLPARIWRPCCCTIHGEKEHDWQPDCDRFAPLRAEVDGIGVTPLSVWHQRGRSISRKDYEDHLFAREINPDRHNEPVDLRYMKPAF